MRKTAAALVALVIALAGVLVVPVTATATDVGQWYLNPATGHLYRQVDNLTWVQAEAFAVFAGGHLATINDQAEQDWLEATFTQRNLWIGFNDRAVEGTWVWSSGEPATYTNWSSGEPNDNFGNPTEDAAVMNWLHAFWPGPDPQPLGWNDLPESGRLGAIVEVTHRPNGAAVGQVSGSYRYWVFDDPSGGNARQVSISARAIDPLSGRSSTTNVLTKVSVAGDITCLVVDGNEAWAAGRITSMNKKADPTTIGEAAFLWVRDGAAAGVPDQAYSWFADPGQTLAEMEAWCHGRHSNMGDFGFPDGFAVFSGDVTVRPGG